MTSKLVVEILTLVVIFVTMVFVIMYWAETQQMKAEMVNQTKISFQNIKSQNMPLVDLQLEVVMASFPPAQFKDPFVYHLFLVNKGNGPAFKIITQRFINPKENKQKIAVHEPPNRKLNAFTKKTSMLGVGEKTEIYREGSTSYEHMKIVVSYLDHFGEMHKSVFQGARDGIEILDYPHLENFYTKEEIEVKQ